ncbi:uncharacterized protein LOC144575110 isoform X1 [Carex rostrata]
MAVAIGGSLKLNLEPRMRMGFHRATARYRGHLSSPQLPFSCHSSLSSSPNLSNQTPLLQQQEEVEQDQGIMCEACQGNGWLLCDFCNGKKTNVQAKKNRIYRRCPTCKAVGCVLCEKCKVYKCVTFPDFLDDVTQL